MASYILRRVSHMLITIFVVSIISFVIIQLPPGSYLNTMRAEMEDQGLSEEEIGSRLRVVNRRFSLDRPAYVQYFRWVSGMLTGDLGYSMARGRPIRDIIGERLLLTMVIAICTLLFQMTVGIVFGVYSALRQYSLLDYVLTLLGFIGLATPNFLLAIILLYIAVTQFGVTEVGGLFSAEYILQPWSLAKVGDLLSNIWIAVIVVGTAGTAGLIRVVRSRMLDTLGEPYLKTAYVKGIKGSRIVFTHALKVAINPVISSLGMSMPQIISGETITALVLGLPTIGPVLLMALQTQDMYLAATILLLLTVALVIGNLLADIALAWLDPRISYE